MEYVTLGKIVRTIGLKGEVKVYSSTDFNIDRYQTGNKVFIFDEKANTRIECEIQSFRNDGVTDIIAFKNMQNINLVEKYVGQLIQVEKNADDLPKDFYFHGDLEGCAVFSEAKEKIGIVSKVEEFCAYKTLRVKRDEAKDVLVPFVKAFIKKVDIKKKEIIIVVLEGLL